MWKNDMTQLFRAERLKKIVLEKNTIKSEDVGYEEYDAKCGKAMSILFFHTGGDVKASITDYECPWEAWKKIGRNVHRKKRIK